MGRVLTQAIVENLLENEAIPLGYRQTIHRYFEGILEWTRSKSTDAEP